ncbi:MAG: T9SS type A sorting domain-containing protein, partial [bacterium]|nr:T9SS type A sorting domain-containing protein [bacterium]
KNTEKVSLKVYDILGMEVAEIVNKIQLPGLYTVEFNEQKLRSGVYFYQLTVGTISETKRMIMLK